jgi:hypothetical protein
MTYRSILSLAAIAILGLAVSADAFARGGARGAGVRAGGFHGGAVRAGGVHRGAYRGAAVRGGVYRGAYRGAGWGAAAVGAAAVGAAATTPYYYDYGYRQCGYYPYPPCY